MRHRGQAFAVLAVASMVWEGCLRSGRWVFLRLVNRPSWRAADVVNLDVLPRLAPFRVSLIVVGHFGVELLRSRQPRSRQRRRRTWEIEVSEGPLDYLWIGEEGDNDHRHHTFGTSEGVNVEYAAEKFGPPKAARA